MAFADSVAAVGERERELERQLRPQPVPQMNAPMDPGVPPPGPAFIPPPSELPGWVPWADLGGAIGSGVGGYVAANSIPAVGRAVGTAYGAPLEALGSALSRAKPTGALGVGANATGRLLRWMGKHSSRAGQYARTLPGRAEAGGFAAYGGYQALKEYAMSRYEGASHTKAASKALGAAAVHGVGVPAVGGLGAIGAVRAFNRPLTRPVVQGLKVGGFGAAIAPAEHIAEEAFRGRVPTAEGVASSAAFGGLLGGGLGLGLTKLQQRLGGIPQHRSFVDPKRPIVEPPPPLAEDLANPALPDLDLPERAAALLGMQGDPESVQRILRAAGGMEDVAPEGGVPNIPEHISSTASELLPRTAEMGHLREMMEEFPGLSSDEVARGLGFASREEALDAAKELREPIRHLPDPELREMLGRKGILTAPFRLDDETPRQFLDRLHASSLKREELHSRMRQGDNILQGQAAIQAHDIAARARRAGTQGEATELIDRLRERGLNDQQIDNLLGTRGALKPEVSDPAEFLDPSPEVDEVIEQIGLNPKMNLDELNVEKIASRFDISEDEARAAVKLQARLTLAQEPVKKGNTTIVHVPGLGDRRQRSGPQTAWSVRRAVSAAAQLGSVFSLDPKIAKGQRGVTTKSGLSAVLDEQDVHAHLHETARALFNVRSQVREGGEYSRVLAHRQEAVLRGYDAVIDNPAAAREIERLAPLPSREKFLHGRITREQLLNDGFAEFLSAWVLNANALEDGAKQAFKVFQDAFDGPLSSAAARKFRHYWNAARDRGHRYIHQGEVNMSMSRHQGDVKPDLLDFGAQKDRFYDWMRQGGNAGLYSRLMNYFLSQDHSLIVLANLTGLKGLPIRGFQYRTAEGPASVAMFKGVPERLEPSSGIPVYSGPKLVDVFKIGAGDLPPEQARERLNLLLSYALDRRYQHQHARLLTGQNTGKMSKETQRLLEGRLRDYNPANLKTKERRLAELGLSETEREQALSILLETHRALARFSHRMGGLSGERLKQALSDDDLYYMPIRRKLEGKWFEPEIPPEARAQSLQSSATRYSRASWVGGYQEIQNPVQALLEGYVREIRSAYWGARTQGVLDGARILNGNGKLTGRWTRVVEKSHADEEGVLSDGIVSARRLKQVQDGLAAENLKLGFNRDGSLAAVPIGRSDAPVDELRESLAEMILNPSAIPVEGQNRSIHLDNLMLDYGLGGPAKEFFRFIDQEAGSPTFGKEMMLEVQDPLLRMALRFREHDNMPTIVRKLAAARRTMQGLVTRFVQFMIPNWQGDSLHAQLHQFATHNADGSVRWQAWIPFETTMHSMKVGWNMLGHDVAEKAARGPAAYEGTRFYDRVASGLSRLRHRASLKAAQQLHEKLDDPVARKQLEELEDIGGGNLSFFQAESDYSSLSSMQREMDGRFGPVGFLRDSIFSALKGWDDKASIFERATRGSEYIRLREAGYRPDQAAFAAGRVSLDFWDKSFSPFVHGMRLLMPFFGSGMSAMVQNLETFLDEMVMGRRILGRPGEGPPRLVGDEPDPKNWAELPENNRRAVLASKALMFSALGMMAWAWQHKDEDSANRYRSLRNDERYEWIEVPGVDVRLRAGFDLSRLFYALPKMILDKHLEEDGAPSAFAVAGWFLGKMNPITTPVGIGVPLGLHANKNFAGIPVVSYWEQRLPQELQYRPSTPWLHRSLGEMSGLSPLKIQHAMGSLGYLGRVLADFGEFIGWDSEKFGERPFAGVFRNSIFPSFQKDGRFPTAGLQNYYAAAHQVRSATSALYKAEKQAKWGETGLRDQLRQDPNHKALLSLAPMVKEADRRLQKMRIDQEKLKRDKTMSASEKESAMIALQQRMEQVAHAAIDRMKPVLEKGDE